MESITSRYARPDDYRLPRPARGPGARPGRRRDRRPARRAVRGPAGHGGQVQRRRQVRRRPDGPRDRRGRRDQERRPDAGRAGRRRVRGGGRRVRAAQGHRRGEAGPLGGHRDRPGRGGPAARRRGPPGAAPGQPGRGAAPGRQPQRDHRRGRGGRGGPRGGDHGPGQHRGQPARAQGPLGPGRAGGHGRGHRRRGGPRRPGGGRGARGDQPVTVLSGRELAAEIRARTAAAAAVLAGLHHPPRLSVVTATDDEASAWYVRSIASAAAKAGIGCEVEDLGPRATADGIAAQLSALSADPTVAGIILTTPLPGGARLAELAAAIDPSKDVDGANPVSLGRLTAGLPAFAPATAEAVIALLDHYGVAISGRRAVVVGRSVVVGKPVAQLLLDRDATVTICHSRTPDLASVTRQADILVVAAGRAGLIGPSHVAPGAVVIDVGTSPGPDGSVVGDVDPAVTAAALSPVPGGVGPVTTAILLRHVAAAASRHP